MSSLAPSAGEEGTRCGTQRGDEGKEHETFGSETASPHLPQLRWVPFLSRAAGEDNRRQILASPAASAASVSIVAQSFASLIFFGAIHDPPMVMTVDSFR